eukprot:gnl/MRDRNA2_/MRDRNA2_121310_c0_seq1.p1 gnl/MRDRNA2_/MRDRNA2_121310_c0~~gnl/MRDRNA2_/MRDRNA2_121310_c0_seq1.p1  ORF type:complete len:370 (-),score=80.45 gnl/MRDRNA2_/MRDRNA2_121310_c0_seq1:8-985(-)
MTGTRPFQAKNEEDLIQAIKRTSVDFEPQKKIWDAAPEAKEVVRSLLMHSTKLRCTAEKLLKHPWMHKDREKVSRSKMMRVLSNVVANSNESTFKKFVMRVIAEDMPPEKVEIVQAAFRYLDKNGDGTLELKEIQRATSKYFDDELPVIDVFEAIDRDVSGTINFAEFMAASIGPHEYCDKETLWHTFNRFDKDGDGKFDKMEISSLFREVETLSENVQVTSEVEEIAKDITMPMDFDTFIHLMYTPAGQSMDTMKKRISQVAWNSFGIDVLGVRHIEPKEDKSVNDLHRSPYRCSSNSLNGSRAGSKESTEPSGRSSRKNSKVS